MTLNQGDVYGKRDFFWNVEHFWGIPYAKPPVGELRWKPPLPISSFEETGRLMMQHTTPCVQVARRDFKQGEDCLTLDIYRPITDNKNLPLAIWIHGGGLVYGDGFDPMFNMTRYASEVSFSELSIFQIL